MESKIGKAKELLNKYKSNIDEIQQCFGNQKNSDGSYTVNPNNDKNQFEVVCTEGSNNVFLLYLDAFYGYYGYSCVTRFNDKFFLECFAEAINKNIKMLTNEAEIIMHDKYVKALNKAKEEADFVYDELAKLD